MIQNIFIAALLLVSISASAQQDTMMNLATTVEKPGHFYNPQWSADGKTILFESTMDGKSAIYTIAADGSKLHKISDDSTRDYGQPSWEQPENEHVVYYGGAHPMQLYLNDIDGNVEMKLSMPGYDAYEPSFGWYGDIAFSSRPIGETPTDIWIYKGGTGKNKLKKLTDSKYSNESPMWSPDGKKIVFVRSMAVKKEYKDITGEEMKQMRNSAEIMIMNADGSSMVNLTDDTIRQKAPSWSGDGKTIYYLSFPDSGTVVNSKRVGEQEQMIARLTGVVFNFSVSPDGKYLAYAASRNNHQAIYIRELATNIERKLIGN